MYAGTAAMCNLPSVFDSSRSCVSHSPEEWPPAHQSDFPVSVCACVRVCVWSVVLFPTTCGQGKVLVLIRAVLQELSSTHSHAFYCEHKNILFKKKKCDRICAQKLNVSSWRIHVVPRRGI